MPTSFSTLTLTTTTMLLFILTSGIIQPTHATVSNCYTQSNVTVICEFPDNAVDPDCKVSNLACPPTECLVGYTREEWFCDRWQGWGCSYAVGKVGKTNRIDEYDYEYSQLVFLIRIDLVLTLSTLPNRWRSTEREREITYSTNLPIDASEDRPTALTNPTVTRRLELRIKTAIIEISSSVDFCLSMGTLPT
ncbi:uncharacterized protein SEPMUDRAFT_112166 [Sphaerulina musiva SO2202]|uniref:Uncharacterized protein n=1 Tax=Sphaerulina musiva (strain SO2202) TaxID=692275 RepID=M3CWT3_SPHMS|nr:uncharacterized protein SEPMUDRAFT_112166 [Sphaerulina musiva SO2202]EMF08136.1 hypothetical protein SEPMUDRAFT_112166 [Sphaerulina musiva SO2202]